MCLDMSHCSQLTTESGLLAIWNDGIGDAKAGVFHASLCMIRGKAPEKRNLIPILILVIVIVAVSLNRRYHGWA